MGCFVPHRLSSLEGLVGDNGEVFAALRLKALHGEPMGEAT